MAISAVNVLLDSQLPEQFRDPYRVYDAKGVAALMLRVAQESPDEYPRIAKLLSDVGRKQAWSRGETFRLSDFKPVIDRQAIFAELDQREAAVEAIEDRTSRRQSRAELYAEFADRIEKETNTAALARGNNIALSVLTGARGKQQQLRDLVSTPAFFPDARGEVVKGFIRHSFAEGLRPYEYLAGTYAARDSVTVSKTATAKGGFLAKTLSRAAARQLVTTDDCGTSNYITLPPDEKDIRGRVLQREFAGFPAGTVIDRQVYSKLSRQDKPVPVRSPQVCSAPDGLCSKCFGVAANGRFPKVGEHIGATAAQAFGEPNTQAALSMKHVVSGKGATKEYSGLDFIQQFLDSPEEFRERAGVSRAEGVVEAIREAPQGGSYIKVAGEEYYAPPDRQILVNPGEALEPGDQLTDGLVDPQDILELRGLGEARKYWVERLSRMGEASNAGMDRRLFEVLSRAVVDHVDLDDPMEEGYLPDDRVRYSEYLHRRALPQNIYQLASSKAVGKYLEQPALHHTVGTRLTSRQAQELTDSGFDKVFVSDNPPGFTPVFVRLQQVASTDDDWLASLGGSYLGAQISQGVLRAQDTNIEENTHPVPRLAVGVGYAERIGETGKF
jgi:hypothetical protein